jgi:hypothetical protein
MVVAVVCVYLLLGWVFVGLWVWWVYGRGRFVDILT